MELIITLLVLFGAIIYYLCGVTYIFVIKPLYVMIRKKKRRYREYQELKQLHHERLMSK